MRRAANGRDLLELLRLLDAVFAAARVLGALREHVRVQLEEACGEGGGGGKRKRDGVVFEYTRGGGWRQGELTGHGEDEVGVGDVEAEGVGGAAGEDGRAQAGRVPG
jgi:hypothetical protein